METGPGSPSDPQSPETAPADLSPPPIPEPPPPLLFPRPLPPRPLTALEGTLFLGFLPVLYLLGTMLSFLPSLGTPLGYVVLTDQAFNMAAIALLGLMAFGLSPRRHLGLARPPARLILLVAAFAAANFVVAAVLSTGVNSWLFTAESVRDQGRLLADSFLAVDTPMEKVWLFLAMVVGAPIAEELFFRGLLQNLLVRWLRPGSGILMTALVFTAFHFVPLRFSLVLEMALILGLLYQRSGYLGLGIVFHAVTNAVAQGVFYAPEGVSVALSRGPVFIPAAFAWTLLGWLLQRELRKLPRPEREERPVAMRWGWFFVRMGGCWILAAVFGLLAIPLAGSNAVALQRQTAFAPDGLSRKINESWETDAAWGEFFLLHSAVRAEVKQGKVSLRDYEGWLRSVRDEQERFLPAKPTLDAREAVEAEAPLPVERAALDRIRVGAVRRFGIEPPRPESSL